MTIKSGTPPPHQGDPAQDGTTAAVNGNNAQGVFGMDGTIPGGEGSLGITASEPVLSTMQDAPVAGPAPGSDSVFTGAIGSPIAQRSRSGSGCSGLSQTSHASASPQHQASVPPQTSLADLQDPEKFSLDMTDIGKPKKYSKAQFHNKNTGLQDNVNDPSDPLSMLDPLWTVKDKPAS